MKAWWKRYELRFKQTARTSRSILKTRTVWFLFLERNGITGIGECAPLPGLSHETPQQVEHLLEEICAAPDNYLSHNQATENIPSVHFALETARIDLLNGGKQLIFPTAFSEGKTGIPINGLIWMADADNMIEQVNQKLKSGFRCIKLKIGGIDFNEELKIIQAIRNMYSPEEVTIRLDVNGAFTPEQALKNLTLLAEYQIHSIEQPIAPGQWNAMARICKESPIPVALDEELIGINSSRIRKQLLDSVKPGFIILKPSLHGGISGCNEWISLASERAVGWWATSYLESNIGLNAIAQWAFSQNASGYQGLGTGSLFSNNIASPLQIRGEQLWTDPEIPFSLPVNLFSQ